MFNSHRIHVLYSNASDNAHAHGKLIARRTNLQKRLPFPVERMPDLSEDGFLQVLWVLKSDGDVVKSLAELHQLGVKIFVQDSLLAKAQVEINERGELELSTGVTPETLRWFLGLEDFKRQE